MFYIDAKSIVVRSLSIHFFQIINFLMHFRFYHYFDGRQQVCKRNARVRFWLRQVTNCLFPFCHILSQTRTHGSDLSVSINVAIYWLSWIKTSLQNKVLTPPPLHVLCWLNINRGWLLPQNGSKAGKVWDQDQSLWCSVKSKVPIECISLVCVVCVKWWSSWCSFDHKVAQMPP